MALHSVAGPTLHGVCMARFVGRHIAPEMLGLWLLELVLSFLLAYAFLIAGSSGPLLQIPVANHAIIFALTIGIAAFTVGLYRPEAFSRVRSLFINTALGGLLVFPATWFVSKALGLSSYWPVGYDALRPVKIVAVWIGALFVVRLMFFVAVRSNMFVHRVAVLGTPSEVSGTVAAVRAARKGFFEVVCAPFEGCDPAELRLAKVHSAVFGSPAPSVLQPHLHEAFYKNGIRIELESVFWERCLKRVDIANLDERWFADLGQGRGNVVLAALYRGGDIVTSICFLLVTLPLMVMVALAVRFDSPGPVLYQQERVGLHGRPFTLLKFRSMRNDAEARGPAWAQQRDPRVTRIGSFMRRTRIDELPQLWNILCGQMSFIGPRPERPHFVEKLAEVIPYYGERARVKPGLTGWAQVNYPYGASVEDAEAKLSYDLYYVKNRSPLLDVLILFATVRVILFQEGSR